VNEDFLAVILDDKAESLGYVEPFDLAEFTGAIRFAAGGCRRDFFCRSGSRLRGGQRDQQYSGNSGNAEGKQQWQVGQGVSL
jgi:hypothetical protein